MRRKGVSARGALGFTLIETAISMAVLLVAGLAATSLFVYSTRYNSGATDRAVAQALAQRQMESLRKTPFGSIAASTTTVASAGRNFTVDGGGLQRRHGRVRRQRRSQETDRDGDARQRGQRLGAPTYSTSGGGNSTVQYGSSAVANAMNTMGNRVLGVSEY